MRPLITLIILLAGTSTFAQNYQLHAVYMYSFMRYIQWPGGEKSEPFTIGVIGDTPLMSPLDDLAESKKVGKRQIVVKQFRSIDEVAGCEMLFVAKSAATDLAAVLKKVAGKPTLVITETEGQGGKGSNINFVYRKGKLAFEINRAAMEKRKLKVATELAKLAILI